MKGCPEGMRIFTTIFRNRSEWRHESLRPPLQEHLTWRNSLPRESFTQKPPCGGIDARGVIPEYCVDDSHPPEQRRSERCLPNALPGSEPCQRRSMKRCPEADENLQYNLQESLRVASRIAAPTSSRTFDMAQLTPARIFHTEAAMRRHRCPRSDSTVLLEILIAPEQRRSRTLFTKRPSGERTLSTAFDEALSGGDENLQYNLQESLRVASRIAAPTSSRNI